MSIKAPCCKRRWMRLALFFLPLSVSVMFSLPRSSADRIQLLDKPRDLIPEFQVNDVSGSTRDIRREDPIVTADSAGAYTIVWREKRLNQLARQGDIYARRYSDKDIPFSDNIRVNRVGRQKFDIGTILASSDADGNTYVFWEELHEAEASEWFVQRIAPDGALQGSNQKLDLDESFAVADSRIGAACFPDGSLAVYGSVAGEVFLQRFSRDAEPTGAVRMISEGQQSAAALRPLFAANNAGRHMLAWIRYDSSDTRSLGDQQIYVRLFGADGSALHDVLRVDDDGLAARRDLRAAVNKHGDAVFAWAAEELRDTDAVRSVYVRLYSAASRGFAGASAQATQQRPERPINLFAPRFNSQRNFTLAWAIEEFADDRVFLRTFQAPDLPVSDIRSMLREPAGAGRVASLDLALRPGGGVIAVWISDRDISSGTSNVKKQGFDANGTVASAEAEVGDGRDAVLQLHGGLALSPNGIVFAYSDYQDITPGMRLRPFDRKGLPLAPSQWLGGEFNLFEPPCMGVDAEGNTALVWLAGDRHRSSVFSGRYSADGTRLFGLKKTENVYGEKGEGMQSSAVAADASGRFVVAWHVERDDFSQIYAQRYTADAAFQGGIIDVSTVADASARWLNGVALNNDGTFIIVWSDSRPESPGLRARRFDWETASAGPEVLVDPGVAVLDFSASHVRLSTTGSFIVSWVHQADEHEGQPFFRLFDGDDKAVTPARPVDVASSGAFTTVHDFDRDGSFAVAWIDTLDAYFSNLFVRRFTAAGEAFGPSLRLNADDGHCVCPAIELDKASLYACWTIDTYTGSNYDIHARAITWEEEPIINNIAAGESDLDPPLAFQLSPNPIGRFAECRYRLHRRSRVSLTLFDVHGRRLRLLLDDMQGPGEHNRRIDGAGLPTGVYYIELRVNAGASVQPLIIGSE